MARHKTPGAAADAVVQAAAAQWAEHEDCRDDISILVAFLDNVPESVRYCRVAFAAKSNLLRAPLIGSMMQRSLHGRALGLREPADSSMHFGITQLANLCV